MLKPWDQLNADEQKLFIRPVVAGEDLSTP
jgi:hypothetical protein